MVQSYFRWRGASGERRRPLADQRGDAVQAAAAARDKSSSNCGVVPRLLAEVGSANSESFAPSSHALVRAARAVAARLQGIRCICVCAQMGSLIKLTMILLSHVCTCAVCSGGHADRYGAHSGDLHQLYVSECRSRRANPGLVIIPVTTRKCEAQVPLT